MSSKTPAAFGKAFLQTTQGKSLVTISSWAFNTPLTTGFAKAIDANQGSWQPVAQRYARAKQLHGHSNLSWVRTGKTLKALKQGKPKEKSPSTTKGVKFQLDRKSAYAYIEPKTIGKGPRGKKDAMYAANHYRELFDWSKQSMAALEKDVAKGLQIALEREMS